MACLQYLHYLHYLRFLYGVLRLKTGSEALLLVCSAVSAHAVQNCLSAVHPEAAAFFQKAGHLLDLALVYVKNLSALTAFAVDEAGASLAGTDVFKAGRTAALHNIFSHLAFAHQLFELAVNRGNSHGAPSLAEVVMDFADCHMLAFPAPQIGQKCFSVLCPVMRHCFYSHFLLRFRIERFVFALILKMIIIFAPEHYTFTFSQPSREIKNDRERL